MYYNERVSTTAAIANKINGLNRNIPIYVRNRFIASLYHSGGKAVVEVSCEMCYNVTRPLGWDHSNEPHNDQRYS